MAEDSGQRGLFASLMALLRPGGGVGQLLLLKAGEITAGQMQQIARELDNRRARASRDSWTDYRYSGNGRVRTSASRDRDTSRCGA